MQQLTGVNRLKGQRLTLEYWKIFGLMGSFRLQIFGELCCYTPKICEFFQTAVDFKYKYVILCQKTQHLFLPLNNKAKRKWNILWFLIHSGNILRFRNDTGLVIVATCIWTLSFVG